MSASLTRILLYSAVNLVLVVLLSPLVDGILRKWVALVHSRIGPPIYQPYLDLLKLMGKEEITSSESWLFRASPIICFAAIMASAMLIPFGDVPPLLAGGETFTFVYLITWTSVMVMLSGISSTSPYGIIGSSREMMMILTVEPVLIIALITMAVKCGSMQFADMMQYQWSHGPSLSLIIVACTFFMAIVAQLARLPFDMVEADQEIMEGPFVEQSGVKLALFKWTFYAKETVFAALFISIFVPWPRFEYYGINVIVTLLKMIILIVVVGLVHVVNPRLRIDQAVRYFGILIFVTLIGLAFALVGS
jgi:formate hydrogenlyase subunit 4